jgi:hypothetical protein
MFDSESDSTVKPEDSAFVEFWNAVLAPKFIRFKHILVGGLTQHSEAIFPALPVRQGRSRARCGMRFRRYRDQVGASGW